MLSSPGTPLLETLLVPDAVFRTAPGEPPDPELLQRAARAAAGLHQAARWRELAGFYGDLADDAWRDGRYRRSLRLLLAARVVAVRAGDDAKVVGVTSLLAMRHRLRRGFLVAEMWDHVQLALPLEEPTARAHAVAWRELATLRGLTGEYQEGIAHCERSLEVCRAFADRPGMTLIHVQTLLERSLDERLSGRLDLATATLAQARTLAEAHEKEVNDLTRGMIAVRQARLHVMTGAPEAGLAAYLRAEALFTGVSADNLAITKISRIECLGALGRTAEALALADELAEECERTGEQSRLGQVLLERAEIQYAAGDFAGAEATARRAGRVRPDDDSLEALRRRRHLARALLASGGDQREAAAQLAVILATASRPDRRDLARTWQALHDALSISDESVLPSAVWFAAGRGALTGAELQRDLLSDPAARWGVHAEREEAYTAAIRLHCAVSDHEAVAQVMELGRADLLNRVLSDGNSLAGPLTGLPLLPPPADEHLLHDLFALGSAVAQVLAGGGDDEVGVLPLPGGLPSAQALDALADVVVMVQLGHGTAGWWSATAVRERGGRWHATVEPVPERLDGVIGRLAAGELLPPRGVTSSVWRALGEVLLPAREIWRGSLDAPRSVVVCPDPRLWHVPYGALLRGDTALLDVAEVVLTPSLRTLCLVRDRARPAGSTGEGAGPAGSLLDDALPAHTQERAALDAWPGGHRPLGGLADVAGLAHPALLYVSGHSAAPGDAALGPSAVTLDSLAALPLPELLLLVGCWSATAASRYGRDPLSLAVGGLLGGARTVLAGVGRIGEQAAARIAAEALRQIADGRPARSALRTAARETRDRYPELGPYDWAGMCVMGAGD
ncbi:CHAT domain-containing protein [Streptomyces sp. NBC_01092]|uniref:CHAT domain-containing protein n=1 Tax=Streptomyces sp. NBC_01092 TaxID=2903748 RepID=UPI0038630191|nr:CHAT domain-containing tetratricopeptide repeat protein [Streptomyces sp. NBC_01092]